MVRISDSDPGMVGEKGSEAVGRSLGAGLGFEFASGSGGEGGKEGGHSE